MSHGLALHVLLGLFVLRVLGQLAASLGWAPFLPPFDEWHSGAAPYPLLLGTQVAIVVVFASIARGVSSGRVRPRRRLGEWLFVLGGLYGAFMLARLVLGETWLRRSTWWSATMPSLFHLVLAAYLLVLGHYHLGNRGHVSTRGASE